LENGNILWLEWWEPDELRGSRPVLRGAEAEMPRSTHPYLKLGTRFVYLVALIDVYSRYIVGWSLSFELDTENCLDALQMALNHGKPEIINSDQGCQLTSNSWIEKLTQLDIKISMDGKGRCQDKDYAAYCTSIEPLDIILLVGLFFLVFLALIWKLIIGCSYKHSPLSL
jgi:transposase InsO family protein